MEIRMRELVFLFWIMFPASALADAVEIKETTEFYDVRGNTAQELTAQMSQLGPSRKIAGRRAWANTEWEVHSKYVLVPVQGGCRIEQPRVYLDVVTTLPRWQITAGSRWKLRASWRKMLANIQLHESVHKRHALLAATNTAAALTELPTQSKCTLAARSAREILRQQVAEARRLSRQFDRTTNFGASEGVGL